jgi:serine/threonine protein kinase/formylglycine-generating enzyme required for sulfatase activity
MSNTERQIREIFIEAVGLPSTEWAAFLARRCRDEQVRSRVQELLERQASSSEFLSQPAVVAFPKVAGSALRQIAEFEIVREVGRGGMGVVYLAEDTVLRRPVALKVLQHDEHGLFAERFRKEALAIARLSHTGIVKIYRTGSDDDKSYIAMEYVEGQTLRDVLDDARSERDKRSHEQGAAWASREHTDRRTLLIAEVAEALEHAHQHKVIHRDVKPSNILVDGTTHARLTDFGIARILSDTTLTHEAGITGSYPYMSPEQAKVNAAEVDHRSDVFSLGAVLYEVLTLERPFEGSTPQEIMRALSEGVHRSVRHHNPRIHRDLEIICHKAIEKLPPDRYQTAGHMAADLRAYLSGQPILAAPPALLRRGLRWLTRHRYAAAGLAVLSLLAALGGLALKLRYAREAEYSWVRIHTPFECEVRVQPADARTFKLLPIAKAVRVGSQRTVSLTPGRYRFTFVPATSESAGQTFGEADILLLNTGKAAITSIDIVDDNSSAPTGDVIRVRLLASDAPPDAAMILTNPRAPEAGPDGTSRNPGATSGNAVPLAPFYIDRAEVSNAEYLDFLRATAADAPTRARLDSIVGGLDLDTVAEVVSKAGASRHHHPHTPDFWKVCGYDAALADRPVVGIRLADAEAFARWRGKRLPTVAEWQAAARAGHRPGDDPEYPPKLDRSRFAELHPSESSFALSQATDLASRVQLYRELAVPVGSPDPLASTGRILHMYGNVHEITSSVDLANLDGIAMGRSWIDVPEHAPLSQIWTFPLNEPYFDRGFRCARSAAPIATRNP